MKDVVRKLVVEELEKVVKNEGCVLLRQHVEVIKLAIKLLKENDHE